MKVYARLDALAMRVPVLRVGWGMFAHPTRPGDLLLAVCSLILMTAFLIVQLDGPYDTDGWFLLATGREIVENGIPYSNPWAFDAQGGEYGIVVQQWLHCVLLYSAYLALGYHGCDLVAVALSGVLLAAMFWAVRTVSEAAPATCLGLCALAVTGCSFYMSVRPTMWTMVALCLVVGSCARWRRGEGRKWLFVLPAVMLLHAQVHMSMMWLDVFAACCFLLPDRAGRPSKGALAAHLRSSAPLVGAALLMCAVAFANPYGWRGALYLFESYGAASYGNVIMELKGALEGSGLIVALLVLYALLPALAALAQRRLPSLPPALLWLAGCAAFLSSVRSAWIAALACALVMASQRTPGSAFGEGERLDGKGAPALLASAAVVVAMGAVAYSALLAPQDVEAYQRDGDEGSLYGLCGWEQADRDLGPIAGAVLADPGRIYTSWEIANSYFEWRGLDVVFDTRPELWEPGITGVEGAHPWRDFVDHVLDQDAAKEYIGQGDWRWYVVGSEHADGLCEAFGLERAVDDGVFALLEKAPGQEPSTLG